MTATQSGAWIPTEAGETLEGELVEVIQGWSDARTNGGKDMDRGWYPLLRIRREDGTERDWHAFTAVAENRVLDKQPLPGEHLTITYLGVSDKTPPKGQNAPKLWKLEIAGRDAAQEARVVYNRLGAQSRKVPDLPDESPPEDTTPPEF